MENLVQKYGKELISELIDIIIIKGNFIGVDLKPLLLKHKVITRQTKTVKIYHNKYQPNARKPDGTWELAEDIRHTLELKNGSGKTLIYFRFYESELPSIMEKLNN